MKTTLKTLLALMLCFALILSMGVIASAETYTPGTYSASSMGRNAPLTVECVFTEDAIESIEVIAHSETAGIGSVAVEQLPQMIVEAQSLGVDGISGATLTSFAIRNAVRQCVEAAGGDAKALAAVPVEKENTDPIEETADVIIVGAGGAGMSAAVAATEKGASVIVVETNGFVGGNTIVSGMGWNAADPERDAKVTPSEGQIKTLEAVLEYDEAEFGPYAETLATLKEQITEYLAGDRAVLFDSPEFHMVQFWTGCHRQGLDGTWVEPQFDLVKYFCENSLDAIHWLEDNGIEFGDSVSTIAGGLWQRGHGFKSKTGAFAHMEEIIESRGSKIMLNVHADSLIAEDGKVVGVLATYKGETPVTLHANKSVILACGGFGANKKMADDYNNYWPAGLLNTASDQISSTMGDGITMALAVGADTEGMGYTQLFPAVNIVTSDIGPCQGFDTKNAIYINKNGERFVSEYAERDVMSKAVLEQPDARHFQIFDDTVMQGRLEAGKGPTKEGYQNFIDRNAFFVADSVEEMADIIGCDAETLQATLDAYNKAVDDQYDPLTGRTIFGDKCDTPPYYISPVMPCIHNTMGGLKINIDNAVVNTDGEAIPGLFAAGEVTGGLHAGNRLGGNAVGDAFTMGRNAGYHAAE